METNNSENTCSSLFDINCSVVDDYRQQVESEPASQLAANACWKHDPVEVCVRRDVIGCSQHVFSHKVETEGKPMTNQRSSGRCWLFAALNVIRLPFCKSLNIDEFEFSQAYLFFWDKIERCNYFLNRMVQCCREGESVEGRLMSFLLHDPTIDGGQWDMTVNLILKYGLVPKKCFPESYSSENSARLNRILHSKLREYTFEIKELISQPDTTDENIRALLRRQMQEVFRIVSITLGLPPSQFTWQYYDKSKVAKEIGPITPKQFYQDCVKPIFDIDEKVCLVNDPRPSNAYGRPYTVFCLGNMTDGRPTVYNNQPIETLMKVAEESIKGGEAVWFGCEVGKFFASKYGIQDTRAHDYKMLLGVDVYLGLCKADRLVYGDSLMTHAMTFTACQTVEGEVPSKWRVENSWGEERGEKGYHVLTSQWFKEFVFEVVVDRKYVPQEVMDVLKLPVIELPAWDPMGALARNRIDTAL
uniref:Bleomycin hydrolase n=2 Tax=Hirondellea gigas TaxID=1518452 RepID=A0A2P2I6B0_9CRUS